MQFSRELATEMKVRVTGSLSKESVNLHRLLEKHQAVKTKHCEFTKITDKT